MNISTLTINNLFYKISLKGFSLKKTMYPLDLRIYDSLNTAKVILSPVTDNSFTALLESAVGGEWP